MKNKKNNNNNNMIRVSLLLQNSMEKKEPGIHPNMISNVFKVKDIRKDMTISGVYISDIITNKCSEFIVITKDTFYKNIPSQDTILSVGTKIRINDRDRKVELLVDNINIIRIFLPETLTYYFLSDKKNYLCVNNIQVLCGHDKKDNVDNINATKYM
jgi:hypothetical protein